MGAEQQLRCLIAAGGTAGHVLPAIAVGDALRARGVQVTFAGSPDRVEAQLVPEAGFELDTFRISGLPRRPSLELARALLLAGSAPRACRRDPARAGGRTSCSAAAGTSQGRWSSRRRRCASRQRSARRTRTSVSRTAWRRRSRGGLFLAYPIDDALRLEARVVGRPIPARREPVPQADARAIFELPAEGRMLGRFRGARRRSGAERVRRRDLGRGRARRSCTSPESRDFQLVGARVQRTTIESSTRRNGSAPRCRRSTSYSAGRVDGLGDRRSRPTRNLRAVSVRDRRPSGANAQHFVQAGGAILVRELELDLVPELVRSLLDDDARLARMGVAMLAARRPDAADEIADELVAMARR